jgi:hypothetical protein
MNRQQKYYEKNKELVKQRVREKRQKLKVETDVETSVETSVETTTEILLIFEYKRMLEYQKTHNDYMLWVTKITSVLEELKNNKRTMV